MTTETYDEQLVRQATTGLMCQKCEKENPEVEVCFHEEDERGFED